MMMKRLWIAAFCVALSTGCPTYRVRRVDMLKEGEQLDKDAVFYSLPRAVVTVDTVIRRTAVTPGRCAAYTGLAADLGLGDDDMPLIPSVKYKVVEHRIGARAEPDPRRVFAVEATPDLLQNLTEGIELSERGLLSNASVESSSQIPDVTVKLVELTANVASKLIGLAPASAPAFAERSPMLSFNRGSIEEALPEAGASQPSPAYSPDKRACRRIVTLIQALRDNRMALLLMAGSQMSREALEARLKRLDEDEQALLAPFTGSREVKEGVVSCEFLPTDDKEHKADLFHASPTRGLDHIDARTCRYPRDFFREEGLAERENVRAFLAQLTHDYHQLSAPERAELDALDTFDGPIVRRMVALRANASSAAEFKDAVELYYRSLLTDALAARPASRNAAPSKPTQAQVDALAAVLKKLVGEPPSAPASKTNPSDWSRYSLALHLEPSANRISSAVSAHAHGESEASGFFYAVPTPAIVEVLSSPQGEASREAVRESYQTVMLPQFGAIASLPAKAFLSSAKYELSLYPDTGALKKFGGSATFKDLGPAITSLGSSAGTVLDAMAAKQKEAQQARQNGVLEALQRERQVLEEKKKIRELEHDLGGSAN